MDRTRRNNNRMRRLLLIMISIVFLFAGLLYSYRRDLNQGKNKITEMSETGYIGLTAGDTIEQKITRSQDFNGISLVFGHRGVLSNAGFITVTVVSEDTGAAVLEKTVPVIALESGESAFFAAARAIEVSGETGFCVRVSYHGIVGSTVPIQLGVTASEAAGTCLLNGCELEKIGSDSSGSGSIGLAFGFVTAYGNHIRNQIFEASAVLLIFLAALYLIHIGYDLTKEGRKRKEKRIFLLIYAVVVTVVLLIRASYAETSSTVFHDLGSGEETALELRDDRSIDSYFTLPADGIGGIQFSVVDTGELFLTDEKLTITLEDAQTGEKLQSEDFLLKEQPEEGFYYVFDDTYNAGTRLSLHIQSEGLHGSVVRIASSHPYEEENTLYYCGSKVEGSNLSVQLLEVTEAFSYRSALVRFLIEMIVGLGFWYLLYRRRMPLYVPHWKNPAEKACWMEGRERLGDATGSGSRKLLMELGALLLFGIVVIEFVYSSGIGVLQEKVVEEVASYAVGTTQEKIVPGQENAMEQTFTVGNDQLSGLGIHLLESGGWEDETLQDCENMQLYVSLTDDETGELVSEGWYRIGDLVHLTEQEGTEATEDIGRDVRSLFVYVPLQQTLQNSEGRQYTMKLYADGTDETVRTEAESTPSLLIVGKNDDNGGDADLILCYQLYQDLPVFYLVIMGITLLGTCFLGILIKWSRVPEWKLAFFWMLFVGGILTFVLPLYCIPDDVTHYRNIYYLSNKILGVFQDVGGEHMMIRKKDLFSIQKLGISGGNVTDIQRYYSLVKDLRSSVSSTGVKAAAEGYSASKFRMSLMENASVWTYLPSVLGFSLVRLLGGNFTAMITAARWCNLIVVSLLITQALRRCPYGRRALMVVAMFPVLLQQIGSCSYDAMIIGSVFIVISYGFHVLERTKVSVMDFLVLLLFGAMLLINKKGVYFPIVMIALLIPGLRSSKKRRTALACFLAGLAAFAGIYAFQMISTASSSSGTQLVEGDIYTVEYLLTRPRVLWHMILVFLQSDMDWIIPNAIARSIGVVDAEIPEHIWILFVVLLVLAILSDRSKAVVMRGRTKLGAIFLCVTGVLIIALTFTVTMSYVGEYYVQGMQGRYFQPYIAFGAVILASASNVELPQGKRVLFWTGVLHFYTIAMIFKGLFELIY